MIAAEPTLAEVVRRRAATDGDAVAYTFLADGAADARSLTWAQLHRRAGARAEALRERGAAGRAVLLALPSGLAFVESLFACWYAGAIAVPASLPRHQRAKHRLDRVVADAGARLAIGDADVRQRLEAGGSDGSTAVAGLTWIDAGAVGEAIDFEPRAEPGQAAVLQYTSGSTGTPRGVVVTHANLSRNSALIAEACGHKPGDVIGGWLPLFHDMGLVGLVIQAAHAGARCVFMPPERFLMRPWTWLAMISDYRVRSSPAPNFAYDLCVDKVSEEQKRGLDLSGWRNALNGSEPVRPATLARFAAAFASCGFRPEAFFPCYGLAEATLFVTGPSGKRRQSRRSADGAPLPDGAPRGHVGCGRAFGDTDVAIVESTTWRRVLDGTVGEIWVAGASCAPGYWNDPAATAAAFDARSNSTETQDVGRAWLRTGDLGLIAGGELFVTGRLRELVIVAGRNLFPVDLERTAEEAHPAVAPSGAAAFSTDGNGTERLIVVAEVRREHARPARPGMATAVAPTLDGAAVARQVRAAVAAEHDVAPHDVVLLRPGGLPRTTSGKVSRAAARDGYLAGTLERLEGSGNVRVTV